MTGPELKVLREQLDLSIAESARQVQVSLRTWYRWEAGSTPIPAMALKLFKLLNKIED